MEKVTIKTFQFGAVVHSVEEDSLTLLCDPAVLPNHRTLTLLKAKVYPAESWFVGDRPESIVMDHDYAIELGLEDHIAGKS